jgi:hypothetical protein
MTHMTHDEYCAEEEAIWAGNATRLMHCYLCEPDVNRRFDPNAGPLRGVARTSTTDIHRDPTEVYHLIPCGHAII